MADALCAVLPANDGNGAAVQHGDTMGYSGGDVIGDKADKGDRAGDAASRGVPASRKGIGHWLAVLEKERETREHGARDIELKQERDRDKDRDNDTGREQKGVRGPGRVMNWV